MRNTWILALIVALFLLAGLYWGGMFAPSPSPDGQQATPHAIDQTP